VSNHPSVPPGSLLGGKFRIDRLLGAGAMGTVYAIDHELTRHKRALKLLHPAVQNIPDIVRRFLNEASAAGRAGNPHLVETFDAGTLPTGEPYVVMELLEGQTLGAVLERSGRLEPSLASELVAQAAEGMEAAHRAGIIHRDLKPENLFVTSREGRPFIKIMDFGVSKFATGTSSGMRGTRAGMLYGSPAYMSPEQLTGQVDVDGRTDVFALGVVLFQCLTGALPFDANTIEALMVRVLRGEPTPIESLRPDLPAALVKVVLRALEANRDDRFPTASALAEALSPFRALPSRRWPSELEFAATVASTPPAPAAAAPRTPPPSLPAGVPRGRRASVAVLALAVLALAAGVLVLAARAARERSPTAGTAPREQPPSAATPAAHPLPEAPAGPSGTPSFAITTSGDEQTSAKPPAAARSGRSAETRAPLPAAPSTPAPSSPNRSTRSQDLGLREDNPFR
jgi:serine/threonine-protein kinase